MKKLLLIATICLAITSCSTPAETPTDVIDTTTVSQSIDTTTPVTTPVVDTMTVDSAQ